MYHTQEKWAKRLTHPIICTKDNAWLGVAWYFWYDTDDATFWGLTSKTNTGYYEVYIAEVECNDILDTVFNEDHYLFWIKQIEKVQKIFIKKVGNAPDIKQLNDFFVERNLWNGFTGIMYQNIPKSGVNEIVKDFQYKKRIQLAVFNKNIILSFALHSDGQCV